LTADPFAYLFSLEQFGIKFGLENIRAIVAALGHPERTFRSVHIAGTNGKGSVTAMVESALRAAGHRAARYTSPHLLDLAERFFINGKPVDRASLETAIDDVRGVIARLIADGTLLAQPTFFEVTTAVGFELFRRAAVEIAVCEVGLGGRLDATNVLEPMATAITSIGLDHQQYLGHSIKDIAGEKAGIIKPGVPVVVGPVDREALAEIERIATPLNARIIPCYDGTDVVLLEPSTTLGNRFRLRTPLHDYGEVSVGLAGGHQIHNAVVAVRLLETLQEQGVAMPAASIVDGLARVSWPARLDLRRLADGREILLDAAHNPDGAEALATFLRAAQWERAPIVFAAMRDKDISGMLAALAPVASAFVLTRARNARSADPHELAEHARRLAPVPVSVETAAAEALATAWRLSTRIIAAGSIFLLGDVLEELGDA